MILPGNSIGISDILAYRECPQKFAFSMRRHTPVPERLAVYPGEMDEPPEATTWANGYGSAVHGAIHLIETTQCDDDTAVDAVWPTYQHWLEITDVQRMRDDLGTYRKRSMTGYRLVAAEKDMRFPLFTQDDGTVIYFRFKIDLLLQHLQHPEVFVTRDYKSGRIPKPESEVHKDPQQWAYNLGVHELYPECERLSQVYDQLRYGEVTTRKSAAQREEMRDWLIRQVKSILGDTRLEPKQNEWCQTCPLVFDCPVTHRSTRYWRLRLAALAPEEKVGRKMVVTLNDEPEEFEHYVKALDDVSTTQKQLKRFEEAVREALKAMPTETRERFGYMLGERKGDSWSAESLRALYEVLGDEIWQLVGITKSKLESVYDPDSPQLDIVMSHAQRTVTATTLKKIPTG